MKLPPWAATPLLFAASVSATFAVERLPIETFSREPELSRALLSPDGNQVAYLAEHKGFTKLHIIDLTGGKPLVRFNMNMDQQDKINGVRKEVGTYYWAGNQRLVLTTVMNDNYYGMMAVNSDGKKWVGLSGWEKFDNERDRKIWDVADYAVREMFSTYGGADGSVLMFEYPLGAKTLNRPDIIRVDTFTGNTSPVAKNPGEVEYWSVDFQGVARVGILSHGDLSGLIYRDSENAAWRTILPLQDRRGKLHELGFDAAGKRILVAALTDNRRWAPFPIDPVTGEMGAPLLADAEYDIMPDEFVPSIASVALAGPIVSRAKQSMVGFRYYTESARTKWFDPEFAAYQKAVDKALPDSVNLLVNQSSDSKRLLWFSFSDQNPGFYTVLDVAKRTFLPVGPRMSWIKPAQMAATLSIKYAARDGLVIHGYLTVPVGYQPKDLPLIVMPHGGPWVRDVWGFDSLVQLLANRGYAVLQMNYRGSTGYGDELLQNARKEIGGKIQDDIEDATRWAIAAGVAKPDRIAIMGSSYGGYSALFALGQTPDLYRCGVSVAGVTDWPEMFEDSDVAYRKNSRKYWVEQIGDPKQKEDLARLRAGSPINFPEKIAAPVLIVQGKEDSRVPVDQARRMVKALEKAGHKPQSLFVDHLGHSYGDEAKRLEIYTAIVDFLEKNLGPGVK